MCKLCITVCVLCEGMKVGGCKDLFACVLVVCVGPCVSVGEAVCLCVCVGVGVNWCECGEHVCVCACVSVQVCLHMRVCWV